MLDPTPPDVDALFDQALDLAPAERARFLGALPDPALRDRLRRLLAAADEPDDLLDRPEALLGDTRLGALAASAVRPLRTADPAGAQVGPYRVEMLIGEGGMGAVYRARRADGAFEQDVALKVVRPGLGVASPATEARFEQERQVLAALDHPGIARLLGGGQTAPDGPFGGVPYLAMEYVAGEPLTDYADQHRLGVEARIDLIRQTCAAVQHAHGRLVVHRDLKPSNVMVAEDDEGRPRVKVLDFGIAKLLGDGDTAGASMLTQTHVRLLTPAYAAPEQFRAEAVTTSADVYALGVLLYELLTGRWPYAEGSAGRRSATEIERVVLEGTPVRASTAVLGEDDLAVRAFARGEAPARLAKRLRGDLDVICAKALHADPERRYASAAALSADLERYLEGLPVEARPDSAAYRMRRFVGRHRAGSLAAAVGLVALLGALGVALWQADRAQASLAAEQAARLAAEQETERVNAVVGFMRGMINSVDPAVAGDSLVSVRSMLAAGRSSAETLAAEPALYASALQALSVLRTEMGEYEAALADADDALAALGADPTPPIAGRLEAARSRALARLGRFDEARAAAERSFGWFEQVPSADQLDAYVAAMALAQAYDNLGQHAEAEPLWRRAVDGWYSAPPERRNSRSLVVALTGLASNLDEQGRDRLSIPLYEDVIALVAADSTLPALAASASLGNLAQLMLRADRPERAVALQRRALAGAEEAYGPEHLQALVNRNNLARSLSRTGQHAAADRESQAALDGIRAIFGDGHPYTGFVLNNRGRVLAEASRFEEAEQYFHDAFDVLVATLGPDHPRLSAAQAHLGQLYLKAGRPADAVPLLRIGYEAERAAEGDESSNAAIAAGALAAALAQTGDAETARVLYGRAVAAMELQHPGSPAVERLRAERDALRADG